jgi:aspartate/methionine/tyrosine aminotransferase
MRRSLVRPGTDRLKYEIRQIVLVAQELQKMGVTISWQNIGDPVNKGEQLPAWIKEIVGRLTADNNSYAYAASQGVPAACSFLAQQVNARGGCKIAANDIIFYNGLGDAVNKVYTLLDQDARVLMPSPVYSTHATAEEYHAAADNISYDLDEKNQWQPDFDQVEHLVRTNRPVAGILLINPDNPTGAVFTRASLERYVEIARKHKLFLICDEIYTNIIYPGIEAVRLCEVIGDVPAIVMRGISKEYPWPGSRCGWIEVLNRNQDPQFRDYVQVLVMAKMLEVCSTTLPQTSIPLVMGDARYPGHLEARRSMFEQRAAEACAALAGIEGLTVVKPKGAFYLSVVFNAGSLNSRQTLPIGSVAVKGRVGQLVQNVELDKRFVYYLLGATGICAVPLTGFGTTKHGFRVTLLENDAALRKTLWQTLAANIRAYLGSS